MMKFFRVILVMILFTQCKKNGGTDPIISAPTITTTNISSLTAGSVVTGGTISNEGGSTVTARGVCWNVAPNPTTANDTMLGGNGPGSFTLNITRLRSNTTYYLRAFATNSAGTSYGNEISFTTLGVNIYLAGYEANASGITVAKVWKNGIATNLTNGIYNAYATAICVSGNDVYVAGYEKNAAGKNVAKYWKNGIVTVLTSGTTNADASGIYVSGGVVYVVGTEMMNPANSIRDARIWTNGVATSLTSGRNSYADGVYVSGSDVYVVGTEVSTAKLWKNGVPFNLSDGTRFAEAWSVYVSGNGVYVSGDEANIAGNQVARYWKNGVLNILPDAEYYTGSSITVNGADVYVAGGNGGQAAIWKNGVRSIISGAFISGQFDFAGNHYACGGESGLPKYWTNGVSTALGNQSGYVYEMWVTN